ncbi:hypothetical protein EV182_000089 [Spiromyces aspiralis]|uniref:Uncharacterized protein n=1 Tax=Spiromyces aspiralis TaxID=68401 RepID=A0ACC1HIZ0_9FUNG|nr:hypothetical protein EV182_000089 [Spiromyces aspiralis]
MAVATITNNDPSPSADINSAAITTTTTNKKGGPKEEPPSTQYFPAPTVSNGPPPKRQHCNSSLGKNALEQLEAHISIYKQVLEDFLAKEKGRNGQKDDEDDWDASQFVQLDKETSDHVKSLIQESEKIERVRKERIFEDDVTESEMEIIRRRVELQQKQAKFERREFAHKANRIRKMYDYLHDDEIREALKQCENNEDEVIYKFSTPGFMTNIRREIALRHTPLTQTPQMTDTQRKEYEELLKKRNRTQKKTTTEDQKNKYRIVGRLPLDEALAQLQKHTSNAKSMDEIDLAKAMRGWSEARIKAFKAIKTKPNTYYYRFNAPGEEQRTGAWSPEEQKLFHARLREIGANGQWGIFSMAIPGRVGYQCSNYYRYLIETRQIHDPNYVLDENGRAHYLFTTKKKNPDGTAVKAFRKHKKPHVRMSRERYKYSDDEDEPTSTAESNDKSEAAGSSTEAAPASEGTSSGKTADKKTSNSGGGTVYKRKRRTRYTFGSDSESDEIKASEVQLSDDDLDDSDGEYRAVTSKRARQRQSAPGNSDWSDLGGDGYSSTSQQARARRRCRIAAPGDATAGAGLAAIACASSVTTTTTTTTTTASSNSGSGARTGTGLCDVSTAGGQGMRDLAEKGGGEDENEIEEDEEDDDIDPDNPLPDLLDPITLEPVRKPAISPYGHVMSYDSWIRCLMFPPEGGKRNVCPLTKKPLSKRDLVILTLENIDEYRSKIVNI